MTPLVRGAAVTPSVRFARLYPEFRAESWRGWMAVLARLTPAVRELYVAAGRGSGKSRVVALLACCYASRRYRLAPGERVYVGIFGPDRRQARLTHRYVAGLLRSRPELAALIEDETRESITLRTGVVIEIVTASTAAPRGRSYALCILEEAAFLPVDETSADPDVEIRRAVRPGLGRVPGSLLVVVSSPYARRGILYDAVVEGDAEDRVVISASTRALNPTFSPRVIARAFEQDPIAAASEYGSPDDGTIEFRADVSGLLTAEAIAAVVPAGVRELPPQPGAEGHAHFDAATGSGADSAALGIAYRGRPAALACIRQWRPPFAPSAAIREAATTCRRYGLTTVGIDRYAPGFVIDGFREHGITARVREQDTSATFVELLGLVNSGLVRLLDVPVLLGELRWLERRPGAGRDVVGHPPRAHDDVAAAASAALVEAAGGRRRARAGVLWDGPELDGPARRPPTDVDLASGRAVSRRGRDGAWILEWRDEGASRDMLRLMERRRTVGW